MDLGAPSAPIDVNADGVVHDPGLPVFDGGGATGDDVTVADGLEADHFEPRSGVLVNPGGGWRWSAERHAATLPPSGRTAPVPLRNGFPTCRREAGVMPDGRWAGEPRDH